MPKKRNPKPDYYTIEAGAKPKTASIRIFDDIGGGFFDDGITADSFAKNLDDFGPVDTIDLEISSPGGSVREGTAIYETLRAHAARVNVKVTGWAASVASLIAMAGDNIEIAEAGQIMIHDPHMAAMGDSAEMKKAAAALDSAKDAMLNGYVRRTGRSRADISEMMTAETWMTADEAVKNGFADRVVDAAPDKMAAAWNPAKYGAWDKMMACAKRADPDIPNLSGTHSARILREMAAKAGNTVAKAARTEDRKMVDNVESVTVELTGSAPDGGYKALLAAQNETNVLLRAAAKRDADKAVAEEAAARLCSIGNIFALYPDQIELKAKALELGWSPEQAKAALFDAMGKGAEPAGGQLSRIEMGGDASDREAQGWTQSILARSSGKDIDPANEYNSVGPLAMATRFALRSGYRGGDPRQIVALAFHTSSDFPNILENIATKSVLRGWEEQPQTYSAWTRPGTLPDFKQASRARGSSAAGLDEMKEGAEYKYGTMGEHAEPITLATYGKGFSISRQAIINDDLSVFTGIPRKMGMAARRRVGDECYRELLDTAITMSDSVVLYHATHANIGAGVAISAAGLNALLLLMRKQTDEGSVPIDVSPAFLLVPPEIEIATRQLLESINDVTVTTGVHAPNTVSNLATLVVDPRMSNTSYTGYSLTAYYLLANPVVHDTFEIAFLNGIQTPFMEQETAFNNDALNFKVRIDCKCKALDWRGVYKDAGV